MADEYGADLRVVAWQQWQVSRARLRTQYGDPWDGSGPGPAGPPVEDPPVLPFVLLAWQAWQASPARLLRQYAAGTFDDSVVVVPPGDPDTPVLFRVLAWQQWQVSRARLRTQYADPWDGDGLGPVAPVGDVPPTSLVVLPWFVWQASRAGLFAQVASGAQDTDAIPQIGPDQSVVVLPWFAGRVPLEQVRFVYASPISDALEPIQPETLLSYVYGRGYHPSRVSLPARLGTVYGGPAQDGSFTPAPVVAEYIPTFRPRRRR